MGTKLTCLFPALSFCASMRIRAGLLTTSMIAPNDYRLRAGAWEIDRAAAGSFGRPRAAPKSHRGRVFQLPKHF